MSDKVCASVCHRKALHQAKLPTARSEGKQGQAKMRLKPGPCVGFRVCAVGVRYLGAARYVGALQYTHTGGR